MAEKKSIVLSEDQKLRAVEILWSWDRDFETGDQLLARLVELMEEPYSDALGCDQEDRTCRQQVS